jgi:dTDP-4-amino-4,6-dideoxygalactose transaminase
MTGRTKAVIAVHLFGQTCDIAEIAGICRARGVRLIEDAAQSLGAKLDGKMSGAFGDIGCFSFFPSKNLGGFGDGGMMVTSDAALAEQMSILRLHGAKPKYHHRQVGINSRLDTLQAALLQVKLARLDSYAAGRQRNAGLYRELLAGVDGVSLPHELPGAVHVYNQFCIRTQARDALRKALADQGIGTEIYYPIPLHLQECFRDLGHKRGDFPVAEECANTSLALPIFGELTEPELREVAGAIKAFFASHP